MKRLRFQKSKALKGIDFFESLRDTVSRVKVKSVVLFLDFSNEAVGFAEELVGAVFFGVEDEVVGAGVGNFAATERFFILREVIPGVIWVG